MKNWIELAKEKTDVRCECGLQMNRLELEEYGKCLFCVHDEKENGK